MTRKIVIAGNWKMNGTIEDSKVRVDGIKEFLRNSKKDAEVVVCVPFTLLGNVVTNAKGSNIHVGAQDCHFNKSGAYTGDVSSSMVKEIGCSHVILGHSERRANHHETNEVVKSKVSSAIENKLIAILCVGESLEEKQSGKTIDVVQEQIKNSLSDTSNTENTIIAYEPIWAIGTGLTPTTEEIANVHADIRKFLASLKGDDFANKMRILYGGSLNPSNAKEILSIVDVDGGLIGGASLKAEDFCKIIDAI